MTIPGKSSANKNQQTNPQKSYNLSAIDLKIIYLISKEQNLSDVAKQLGITLGAVSQRLRAMEEKFDMPLAIRKPLQLTEAGEIALKFCQAVNREYEQMLLDMANLRSDDGSLRVIAIGSVLIDDAIPALRDTSREFIHLKTVQMEGTASEIVDAVRLGKADIGLVGMKQNIPGLVFEIYRSAQCVCLMHKDHPLKSHSELTLAEIAAYPMPDLPITNLLAQRLNTAEMISKVLIKSSHRTPNLEIAATYAASTPNGICITLDSIAKRYAQQYEAHIATINAPWATFDIYTVTREIERRSGSMTLFINKLRQRYRNR